MARPRIHEYWIDKICTLAANRPDLSGAGIHRLLEEHSNKAPTSVPNARTVGEIKRRLTPAEAKAYRYFTWPQTMLEGELPWEASRAALDLLRYRQDKENPLPLVWEVKWFWRVTLASPDAPMKKRAALAMELALKEKHTASLPEQGLTLIQWQLAYQPWRSPENEQAWLNLPEELRRPLFYADHAEVLEDFVDLDEGN